MKKAFSFICVGLMALSCTGERAGDLVSQDLLLQTSNCVMH